MGGGGWGNKAAVIRRGTPCVPRSVRFQSTWLRAEMLTLSRSHMAFYSTVVRLSRHCESLIFPYPRGTIVAGVPIVSFVQSAYFFCGLLFSRKQFQPQNLRLGTKEKV